MKIKCWTSILLYDKLIEPEHYVTIADRKEGA